MIFMKESRESSVHSETNDNLRRSWDDHMNTTAVTLHSVKQRVHKIVTNDPHNTRARQIFSPKSNLPTITQQKLVEEANSTPKLI
jgi:hypothetical protein